MRQEMRQLLTPRMIQSMEILQLPLMALEERIEQEMESNPVLEFREQEAEPGGAATDGQGEQQALASMLSEFPAQEGHKRSDPRAARAHPNKDFSSLPAAVAVCAVCAVC